MGGVSRRRNGACGQRERSLWVESPLFKYRNPVAPHELGRFSVHTDYLKLATRVLDSVIDTYGSERDYRAKLEGERQTAMTPDELVKSAGKGDAAGDDDDDDNDDNDDG
eukprot:470244-Prorocentrum_minimum.AAC.1